MFGNMKSFHQGLAKGQGTLQGLPHGRLLCTLCLVPAWHPGPTDFLLSGGSISLWPGGTPTGPNPIKDQILSQRQHLPPRRTGVCPPALTTTSPPAVWRAGRAVATGLASSLALGLCNHLSECQWCEHTS